MRALLAKQPATWWIIIVAIVVVVIAITAMPPAATTRSQARNAEPVSDAVVGPGGFITDAFAGGGAADDAQGSDSNGGDSNSGGRLPRPDGISAGDAQPAPAAPAQEQTAAPIAGSPGGGGGSSGAPGRPTLPPGSVVPGASNTGVPAGTTLTRYDGDIVITTPGTVISGLDIHGFVRVEAPGVVIRNSVIRGRNVSSNAILIYAGSAAAAGLVVEDTELAAAYPSHIVNGVYGYGFTLRRVNIHDVIDAVHIFGPNVLVESSWIHDNLHYENDPGWGGGPSHDDSVQIQTGSNIRILGNTISGAHNAALQLTQDQGATSTVTFAGNWASGGACTVNVAEKGRGAIQGLSITGNVFGGSQYGCAMLVPPTTQPTLSGNSMSDGSAVRIDRRAQ